MGSFETSEPQPAIVEMGLGQELPPIQAEVKPTLGVDEEPLKRTEKEEAKFQEAIKRRAGESQAAYLERSNDVITSLLQTTRGGKLFDPSRLKDGDLTTDETVFIEQVMTEVCQETTEGVGEKPDPALALKAIEQSMGIHSFPNQSAKQSLSAEAAFDKTERSRKLFEKQPTGSARRESYWNTLVSPYVTPEVAKKMLNDKTILLLGGGRSRLKEEMMQYSISPREVMNVDPNVSVPEPGADPVAQLSATDQDLVQKLTESKIGKIDEIWAEYSVPAYLKDPEEIKQLFTNIDALLADGGTARIWPTEVGAGSDAEVLARKTALMDSLQTLAASGKYEIVARMAAGRPGFTLYKLLH